MAHLGNLVKSNVIVKLTLNKCKIQNLLWLVLLFRYITDPKKNITNYDQFITTSY